MASREAVFPALPLSTAAGRVIASPFQFVLTGEDRLRMTSWNSKAGVKLALQGRRFSAAGVVETFAFSHVPLSDRSRKSENFAIGAGPILNLSTFASDGLPRYGETFVVVDVVRGGDANAPVLGTLVQGYLTLFEKLAWPGSPVQASLDGPGLITSEFDAQGAPPGTDYAFAVSQLRQLELFSFKAVLTTSATAATRIPLLQLFHSIAGVSRLMFSAPNPGTQGASDGHTWMWVAGLVYESVLVARQNVAGWPVGMPIPPNAILALNTANLQSGDEWTDVSLNYREHLTLFA